MKYSILLLLVIIFISCRKDVELKERINLIGNYDIIKTRTGYSQGSIIDEKDTLILSVDYLEENKNIIFFDIGGYWGIKTYGVNNEGEVHYLNVMDTDSYKVNITYDDFYHSERHWAPLGSDITTTYSGLRIE